MSAGEDAIVVEGLHKRFKGRRGDPDVVAVDDMSFRVPTGRTLGLVGESGSGKSTVARLVLGLLAADEGRIEVLGRDVRGAGREELRRWRRDMQIVFQEPYESLDPRVRIGEAIAEPLRIHTDLRGSELRRRVADLLEKVQLDPALETRLPHQLSGGQQQRVNIARALATEPRVVVLDEPTSSLDVSVRAEVLRLLVSLQEELALTYLMISHDLPTIRTVCDRVAVMYLGRLVEIGPVDAVLSHPEHPYTEFLLGAELPLDPDQAPKSAPVPGEARVGERPAGCIFQARCPLRVAECESAQPPLAHAEADHEAACVHVGHEHHVPGAG
ncbi:MAG: ATP-binding cassette domain-containing protein [Thermoleophilia bacterium]